MTRWLPFPTSGSSRTVRRGVAPEAVRAAYREFLMARLDARPTWVPPLVEAVEQGPVRDDRGHRVSARLSPGPPEWIPELKIGREDA